MSANVELSGGAKDLRATARRTMRPAEPDLPLRTFEQQPEAGVGAYLATRMPGPLPSDRLAVREPSKQHHQGTAGSTICIRYAADNKMGPIRDYTRPKPG